MDFLRSIFELKIGWDLEEMLATLTFFAWLSNVVWLFTGSLCFDYPFPYFGWFVISASLFLCAGFAIHEPSPGKNYFLIGVMATSLFTQGFSGLTILATVNEKCLNSYLGEDIFTLIMLLIQLAFNVIVTMLFPLHLRKTTLITPVPYVESEESLPPYVP